jgi:hypothetical protein
MSDGIISVTARQIAWLVQPYGTPQIFEIFIQRIIAEASAAA